MCEVFAFVVRFGEREGVGAGAAGEVVGSGAGGFVGYAGYGEHVGAGGTDWRGVSWKLEALGARGTDREAWWRVCPLRGLGEMIQW